MIPLKTRLTFLLIKSIGRFGVGMATISWLAPAVWAQSPQATMVIETTQELNPQTPAQLMGAVQNLLNVGANDVAREYFLKLTQIPASDAQLAMLYERLGPTPFLQLGREAALSPEGAEFASRVIAAANVEARNPQQLKKQLVLISGDQKDQRIAALHRFAAGREQAAVMLLKELADPHGQLEKPRLRAAWGYFGKSEAKPLVAALYTSDGHLLVESLQALSVLKAPDSTPHLAVTALYCQDPILRNMAIKALRRSARIEDAVYDVNELEEFVVDEIEQRLSLTSTASQPDLQTRQTIWNWSTAPLDVRAREVNSRTADLLEANRLCYRLAQSVPEYANLYLITELALIDNSGTEKSIAARWKDLSARYHSSPELSSLATSLAWSLEHDVPEAAITASEFLSLALSEDDVANRGFGEPEGIDELSRALRSPNRQVRDAAAFALMKLNPPAPFTGAADLLQVALRMATTVGDRRAIVVHPITAEADQLSGLLTNAQWTANAVRSGEEALRLLLASGDFEFILLSDEVFRPSYSEVLQQLKGDFRTQQIPLVLLTKSQNLRQLDDLEQRWNVQAFPFPIDETSLAQVLQRVKKTSKPNSHFQQIENAKSALRWLAEIADHPRQRANYELAQYDATLVQTLNNPELLVEAAAALGNLGTPAARSALQDALKFAPEGSEAADLLKAALARANVNR